MEIAKIHLKVADGHTVPIFGVTPAEIMILNKAHERNAKGLACLDVEKTGESKRSDINEARRLRAKYTNLRHTVGNNEVNTFSTLYPGETPRLPQTFIEVGYIDVPIAKTDGPQNNHPDIEGEDHTLPVEESVIADAPAPKPKFATSTTTEEVTKLQQEQQFVPKTTIRK